MKLVKAHATNYRNIIDSNPVDISQSTCLVGKNEAGKTAFLKALECLRSTNPDFNDYGKIENYPRRYLADYDSRHSHGDAIVMRTEWEMDDGDVAAIEIELGEGVVTGRIVTIEKTCEHSHSDWKRRIRSLTR